MHLFDDLGLQPPLIRAVAALGFDSPTPIQEKVIPLLLEKSTDLVALSQTGTGKTAAFGLPLLSMLDFTSSRTQGLILCPTRELCMQITSDLEAFAKYLKKVNITAVYGGASISQQIKSLQKGSQIVVGTPGRMLDLIRRKKINIAQIDYMVLDEADEMLNMGFKEDLDAILSQTPENKNTWLFSATMPKEVYRISREYMRNPIEITMGEKNQGNENIEHVYYALHPRDRYPAIKRLADFHSEMFGIVFCRTRRETKELADRLISDGYSADALHGDLSQPQRDHVMKRYRAHMIQFLIATDVAARGIDIDDITHVIHYSLPDELEYYTHRSGRTARAGKKGVSVLLAGPSEQRKIKSIEKRIKKKFTKEKLPTTDQVKEKQLFRAVKNIQETVADEKEFPNVWSEAHASLDYLSREELINRMLLIEYSRMHIVDEKEIREYAVNGAAARDTGKRDKVMLFVNLGKKDQMDKFDLLSFLSQQSGVPERLISIVEVNNTFSLLRVNTDAAENLLAELKNSYFGQRAVKIERSQKKAGRKGGNKRKNNKSSKKRYFEQDFRKKKKHSSRRKKSIKL